VERLVSALGLEARAHLVGFQQEVRPYLALMDAVVFTGLTEGFSVALLEAMAMARPVVVVEGPMTEVVRHGWNGLVVPVSNPERLAEALRGLLGNREMAVELGRHAAQDTQQFCVEAHVERLTRFYRRLVEDQVCDPSVAETRAS
jgi:glycosyltransferase involved in cell wall biosynthesis